MATIVKKAITDSDLNHAFSIRTKVFVEEQNVPKDLEIDEWEEKAIHFLAWENELPIGTCRLRFVDQFTAKVERVAVLKEKKKNRGRETPHANSGRTCPAKGSPKDIAPRTGCGDSLLQKIGV